jgi:SAM-dependent methyltransferase
LDVGCGTGHWARALAERGARVVGIDVSAPMLAAAQAKRIPGAAFAQASALRLPFADATFDLVVCVTALEFVPDRKAAVAEMLRVLRPSPEGPSPSGEGLKPGGRLVVGVLNRRSLWYWLYWRARGVYAQAHLFTPEELRALLAGAGGEGLELRSALFFPPWKWLAGTPFAAALEVVGARLWPGYGAFLAGSAVRPGPAEGVVARTAGIARGDSPPLTAEALREAAEQAIAEDAVERMGS